MRDSENTFFVEKLEHIKEIIMMFLDMNPEMLETLYFDDESSIEQIVSPLGKLFRLMSTEFTSQILLNRMQMFGKDGSHLSFLEMAWIISIYASSLSNRVSYQVKKYFL